jgi:phosphoesterase RecJ-like protein
LRSKGDINVARVAERFGGGGHRNAAGLQIDGVWDEAEKKIVDELSKSVYQSEA